MSFKFFVPTHLLFGAGCLSNLHKQRLPGQRALIVISNGRSTRANGYLARVEEELHAAGAETHVYDGVLHNPVLENVAAGAALARSARCDFIVGLGSGSSIDCAKAIAVMATNDGSFWDYLFGGTAGRRKMKADPLPLVAIPTTAGTGTELDPWMVVSNEETHEKIGGGNDRCFPVLSVVDPELMTTLPPRLTAFQGFDALFHGIECYLSKQTSPLSDLFSREVVSAVAGHLARACADGRDIAAREQVAYGSTLAGVSMTLSSNGSHHAMEHALSAFHHELPTARASSCSAAPTSGIWPITCPRQQTDSPTWRASWGGRTHPPPMTSPLHWTSSYTPAVWAGCAWATTASRPTRSPPSHGTTARPWGCSSPPTASLSPRPTSSTSMPKHWQRRDRSNRWKDDLDPFYKNVRTDHTDLDRSDIASRTSPLHGME